MLAGMMRGHMAIPIFSAEGELLGHDRLGTTQIYLNPSPEEVIREFSEKW